MFKKIAHSYAIAALMIAALCSCSANVADSVPAPTSETVIRAAGIESATKKARTNAPAPGTELGSFSTEFGSWPPSRSHNIGLAAKKINGFVLEPGELFSFNETLGPTTAEAGYKKAKIFIKGREDSGYGGGICQVSSTLFNACDYAGLEVTERHDHSKEVSYVEKGRDAATSYGGIDLKFVNNKPYTVKIAAETRKNAVVVRIIAA